VLITGRPVYPGVVLGATRLITPHELLELHQSRHHQESDREIQEIFRSPDFRIHALSELSGTLPVEEDQKKLLEVTFWSGVNEVLESRGGGIVFAVASVISRYLRSMMFSLDPTSEREYRRLVELGRSVLAAMLAFRERKYASSPRYIVLASSLSLSEAVSLEPRIVGYALGTSVDVKLRIAAELLRVPAVAGLEGIEDHARELRFVRLDGTQGTLEDVPEGTVIGNG